jgi:hypothetical protein
MKWTTRGLRRLLGYSFRGENVPGNFYLALITAATPPTAATKRLSELTQIATGYGYANGGVVLTRNDTDFTPLAADDLRSRATLRLATKTVTASGGPIPASGSRPRYVALTGDNATVADREVWAYWDLGTEEYAPAGASFDIEALRLILSANAQFTVVGMAEMLDWTFRAATAPTNLYMALVTSAAAPTAATETMSELTQIAAGYGYSAGGYLLARSAADFDTLNESDVANTAVIGVKGLYWSATGGPIPASGDGVMYGVLTTDEGTVSARKVLAWWPMPDGPKTALAGNQIALRGATATFSVAS